MRRQRGLVLTSVTALAATVSLAAGSLIGAPAVAAGSSGPGYRLHDYGGGQVMSILPPGENGLVNAADLALFEANGTRPAHSQDQLGKYAGLLYGYPGLTDSTLSTYYDDESFGVRPGDVTSTVSPEPGVTIYRDQHDVPHIYGKTDAAAAFGAGYAQAQDRLFLMDVLRHYGEGTLASFLGGSCAFEQMDHDELLLAPYTAARAQRQINQMAAHNGATGRRAKTMIDNYVLGINAYIAAAKQNPQLLPADYAAAAPTSVPQNWTPADVVAVAGLIGGIFGRGGGSELADAHLLQYLRHKYGARAGTRAYLQVNHQNDPTAPTTVTDRTFPYDLPTAQVDPRLTAMPDYNKPLTGGPTDTATGCNASTAPATPAQREALSVVHALNTMPQHMSNALVVNGNKTANHHPIAVFGPQVSYFAPQILSEEEIQAPHYSAEGASFPGTGLVELGRGQDYAWSATSAGSDLIDVRVEKLCKPGGGKPGPNQADYAFRGHCLPMIVEHYNETVYPKPGGQGAPAQIDHTIYRTRHGVVQGWTTVKGVPVAIVNQRSTYNHDIDSAIGFLQFADPGYVHNVGSWMRAASHVDYTFNWFYVDNRDTGYFASGLDPVRNPRANTSLPTWGTGGAEWRGYLSEAQHVHEVNPAKGYFVSWNNKPAPGWADDGGYAYGQTYRSTLLVNQLRQGLTATHNRLTRADVVQAMERAATQDLDGTTVTAALLRYVRGHHEGRPEAQMVRLLQGWVATGSHRRKAKPGNSQYAHAAAIAIDDELMPNLIQALYNAIFAGGGTTGVGSNGGASTEGYNVIPMQWVNTPNSGGAHLGSSYDGGFEGYLLTTLQQLMGQHPRDAWGQPLLGHLCAGGPSTCRKAINHALAVTYQALVKANGTHNPAGFRVSSAAKAAGQTMPQFDAIAFRALGVVGQPTIDWQNRPTFQQVVQFPRHRAR